MRYNHVGQSRFFSSQRRSLPQGVGLCLGLILLFGVFRPVEVLSSNRIEALVVIDEEVEVVDRDEADEWLSKGVTAFEAGRLDAAITCWKEASDLYIQDKNPSGSIRALFNLGAAYQFLGEAQRAYETLERAVDLAEKLGDRATMITAKRAWGSAAISSKRMEQAETLLLESLALVREEPRPEQLAPVLNDLGTFYARVERYDQAVEAFAEALQAAEKGDLFLLALKIRLNTVVLETSQFSYPEAATGAKALDEKLQGLDDTYEKAFLLLGLGQVYQDLEEGYAESDISWKMGAHRSYTAARAIGQSLGNKRILTYAEGYLGQLYAREGRVREALSLIRKAAFYAQEEALPDALYLWQWEKGRLFAKQGRIPEALSAYRNSLNTLSAIRTDVMGYGNRCRCSSFREEVGPLYYELSDLLLQYADTLTDEEKIEQALIEARGVVETFKSVELKEYFQDDCVGFLCSKIKEIGSGTKGTAIVYIIPLSDRIEFLLTLPSGLKRLKTTVDQVTFNKKLERFRKQLENRASHRYKKTAKKLYDWLIRPIEPTLEAEGIDTLVFLPDGLLRTIPMASLHDGKKFLIEKYALAVSPGLTLMDPQAIQRDSIQLLLNGLSEAVEGFSPLPFVPQELERLEQHFSSTKLLNEDFTVANATQEITETPFSIVHIASHGQFSSRAEDTFVLTMDGKMSLDDLENLIRPAQLRDNPIELLTLSACQTAAGDDRAALGLAGIAIKAGARSALGTLWFVSDEATAILLEEFYVQLKNPRLSKAQALQKAQVALLQDKRFRHPRYWSPYLLIGNWL